MASNYSGPKWGDGSFGSSGGQVTWSFASLPGLITSFDRPIDDPAYQNAIRSAFGVWESLAVIDFIEVSDSVDADIRVGWDTIDGPFGVVGHAEYQYWMIAQTMEYAEISFDLSEVWRAEATGDSQALDFHAVAVHEIGHVLGLEHSTDPLSIMYSSYGVQRSMSAEDIAGIQSLYGGKIVAAGDGSANLVGTSSNDSITGGAFGDTLTAGLGNDSVAAGLGADIVFGNQGDDLLFGNQQSDTIYGGQGRDEIAGGQDEDQLFGNLGDDVMFGNLGADYLHGGQDADYLHGGQGEDVLVGGVGDDILFGGLGSDVFVFAAGHGSDTIADFRAEEGDRLDLSGQNFGVLERDGSTVLTLDDGGTITLLGVSVDVFQAGVAV